MSENERDQMLKSAFAERDFLQQYSSQLARLERLIMPASPRPFWQTSFAIYWLAWSVRYASLGPFILHAARFWAYETVYASPVISLGSADRAGEARRLVGEVFGIDETTVAKSISAHRKFVGKPGQVGRPMKPSN